MYSKCVFKIDADLDYEKLMFLRCGLDEGLRNYEINYSDDINLFNYKDLQSEEILVVDFFTTSFSFCVGSFAGIDSFATRQGGRKLVQLQCVCAAWRPRSRG